MKFETKARPITTAEDLHAAIEAGARVEYTACGCEYDEPGGGWVAAYSGDSGGLLVLDLLDLAAAGFRGRLRAFYPAPF